MQYDANMRRLNPYGVPSKNATGQPAGGTAEPSTPVLFPMNATDMPLRATMCATCPFRANSPYAALVPTLTVEALTNASRICHLTGSNAIHRQTGNLEHLCRGARDVQNSFMFAKRIISAATDEAWNFARVKYGFTPTIVKDP